MNMIPYDQFEGVELRAGTIVSVEEFPEARKPAYKITADFGEFGTLRSSVQITHHYSKEELIGKQIVGVLNLGTKQIGPFTSEFLTTGFPDKDGNVVLIHPGKEVPNGAKLF